MSAEAKRCIDRVRFSEDSYLLQAIPQFAQLPSLQHFSEQQPPPQQSEPDGQQRPPPQQVEPCPQQLPSQQTSQQLSPS
ncbi:unnamed protein product [Didymodactylos carnosus]|uniref:Uncharacterized protein n=1 Tax=Didymodactylos carnosus TaxID=1234261 RepID=A0A814M0U6_9BILA|nr:unnamed protein product [Didymodactylos carnosus]CAF1072396.1 unnamed protein product [Didymodactylos carnosus]CAF3714983.1 unnamed protein product [Didymodactylos carnosus]CAF3839507.1 unnamed protein product [Didymodactylos carnosus]